MSTKFDVVAIKSFGDLVIAVTCIAETPASTESRFLLGRHLCPLFHALGSAVSVVPIDLGESDVPSFFDVRKNGLRRAVLSGLSLRRSLSAAAGENVMLFDRLGPRERFLANGRSAQALPAAENIYQAYQSIFGPRFATALGSGSRDRRVGIFPGSRLPSKNLPIGLIAAIAERIAARGGTPELFLLEGERPDVEGAGLKERILPRSFAAMVEAVRQCDAVVSADSMPGHIAEMLALPVFIFTPLANSYWLPYSAFTKHRWSLFEGGSGATFTTFLGTVGFG